MGWGSDLGMLGAHLRRMNMSDVRTSWSPGNTSSAAVLHVYA
jgi:hypothetical protein